MRHYIAVLLQLIVWSAYTLAEWLSVHDKAVYKIAMFFIFFYLAVYVGKLILKSAKQTLFVSIISLCCYAVLQLIMDTVLPAV